MTTTETAEATTLPWVVLNCFCTQILGEYATELEAETAAAEFGNCSFPYPRANLTG